MVNKDAIIAEMKRSLIGFKEAYCRGWERAASLWTYRYFVALQKFRNIMEAESGS